MSSMEKIRPFIRDIVNRREDHLIDPILWTAAYEHIPGTDITADSITLAIAEFRKDLEDLELLRSRQEVEE